ncbi:MAG: DUF1592 domain-containing protein [Myxococcaceae bacterium]|nr:DUF1592 domain-containing protein [Myxococcaceae bacterium]
MSSRALIVLCLALTACDGAVLGGRFVDPVTGEPTLPNGPQDPLNPNDPMEPEQPLPGPRFTCTQPLARGTTFKKLRRLSRLELQRTLDDLLGTTVMGNATVAQPLAGLPPDELESLSTLSDAVPTTWASTLATVARRAVPLLLASTAERTQRLGACTATTPLTATCVRSVITGFGARVWRRPLDTAEVDTLFTFYTQSGGGEAGLGFVLRRLLQSPSLTFHLEDGGADLGGRIRLTPHEVASRLSYVTTSSMPDAMLQAAADADQLSSVEQVRAHAERLLASQRGRERVRDFFRYYLHSGVAPDPFAPAARLFGVEPAGLGEELAAEALDFSEHVFWSSTNGTFADLMTATYATPSSPRVARIFGATCATSSTQELPATDSSVFWHADGAARGAPPAQLTQSGWFVWELPAGRITLAATRVEVEVVAAAADGVALDLQLNVDDVTRVASFSAAPGTRIVSAPLTLTAGAAVKVGLYFRNAAAGRSLQVRRVTFLGAAPAGAGCGQLVQTPRHPGLLHRPALLATPQDRTSPILRGAHVRKRFLCTDLPTPDPELVSARMTEVGNLEDKSNRERVTLLTGAAACTGCHGLINPLGFSFEGFDQTGAPRTSEQLFDAAGMPAGFRPLDTRVEKPRIDSTGGPRVLADSYELTAAMAKSPTAAACFTQRAFEFFRLANFEAADGCALANAEQQAKSGSLRDVVLELVATDDFFYRSAP